MDNNKGNSLVVYVVCMKKSMQTVTNLFIMNLALSDILMCLLAVPFTPISFFQEDWQLGKFLCHLVPFSLGVSVYVSTLTSLAIAIDRYFVIVHPYKPRMKLGVCCLLIAVVWIVSISISLPLAIYMELHPISNKHGQQILKCNVIIIIFFITQAINQLTFLSFVIVLIKGKAYKLSSIFIFLTVNTKIYNV